MRSPAGKDKSDAMVKATVPTKKPPGGESRLLWMFAYVGAFAFVALWAFYIRLNAVFAFGKVIHEFDPWFNFRATQYLVDHGWDRFFRWFDDQSWYPLGRPVGTTVYPGMMITAAAIFKGCNELGFAVSLNDVCVFIPAFFGAFAALFTGGITYEASRSVNTAVIGATIMAIIPAHIMRSVAGGYDNESVAVTAICSTFYFWLLSLRGPRWWPMGIIAGLSYFYMVAAWGGYVFVLNMVGVHAGVLGLVDFFNGTLNRTLYRAYSLFFAVGTIGALQVPIVGWAPLQSLEQLGPMAVFLGFQVLMLLQVLRSTKLKAMTNEEFARAQLMIVSSCVVLAAMAGSALADSGKIWGLSVRIRSLFIKHTKTGNPLVDSVAEHQSTPRGFYMQYLHMVAYWAPAGVLSILYDFVTKTAAANAEAEANAAAATRGASVRGQAKNKKGKGTSSAGAAKDSAPSTASSTRSVASAHPPTPAITDAQVFLVLYNLISIYFAGTMVRLILLVSPAASAAGAIGFVRVSCWSYRVLELEMGEGGLLTDPAQPDAGSGGGPSEKSSARRPQQQHGQMQRGSGGRGRAGAGAGAGQRTAEEELDMAAFWDDPEFRTPRLFIAAFLMLTLVTGAHGFQYHCRRMAVSMSHPSIMLKGRDPESGEIKIYDDFREAYWWLRDNTPEDARVMAWWDYGYQITGIGNRTTIADGNTWNHEHIALLGRALTGSEQRGSEIAIHLADYVLVWTTRYMGMMGDDLAKSPHMARIASSVYKDIDASEFYMNHQTGEATPMMRASLLYRLHNYKLNPEAKVDKLEHFEEAYTTSNQMVRIYKVLGVSEESKAWFRERRCSDLHAPCAQQRGYPPALRKIIDSGTAFSGAKFDGSTFDNRKHHKQQKTAEGAADKGTDQEAAAAGGDEDDEFGDPQPAQEQETAAAGPATGARGGSGGSGGGHETNDQEAEDDDEFES